MRKIYLLLSLIVIFSFALRIYKIDTVPPSLTWDEAAVGYNAFTIANWGADEYGRSFPLIFRSFGEDKQPIHIYATAIFVKLFGLSEFSTRVPAAVFGSLNVLFIFFLARIFFKNNLIALFSSLFLAISPQNIFFSRFNHEANFALFFLMLGLLLFYQSIKKGKNFLVFSFLSFILSMLSYNGAKIVVPLILILLPVLYFKQILENKLSTLLTGLLTVGFIAVVFLNPSLILTSRYNQTAQGRVDIEKTLAFQQTHNYLLGRINLVLDQYFMHFNPKYLFETGDKNSRLSAQGSGEFYKIDALFLIIGLGYLLYKRSKTGLLMLFWALIGPLPSSLFAEAPHAGRAAFMMGSWNIVAAIGFYTLINFFKKPYLKRIVGAISLVILMVSLMIYLKYYFDGFPKRYAIDWQYGFKQVVEYIKGQNEYREVFVTTVRSQPYIFFLYYLKMPLPDYLESVIYNNAQDKSSNNVSFFDKYSFGGWNSIENDARKGVLYVLGPSEYDGLRYRSAFDVKKIIYYPNETTAFFLVSLK